ncbi:Pectate lyase [Dillenia turbinata]|uniref:Pectate lyase n=1 Tax=Dillenia turbinata TaxID=194707 RepID=A0AAN8VID4_9MAGN
MAFFSINNAACRRAALLLIVTLFLSSIHATMAGRKSRKASVRMNVIDRCWRRDVNWRSNRQKLATCSVGFAGKMWNNIGGGIIHYQVTDPSDDPVNPRPGTLRYGASKLRGKVWITFKNDMEIKLQKSLMVSSFTAIDGRGASIHIAGGGCFVLYKVTNVIIHGLKFHDCQAQSPGLIMGPDSGILPVNWGDGDAIRLVTASKVWIDHNTLYDCPDGLIDVTRGSTNVTISNNWFRNQNKVMLLSHDDGSVRDKNMRVTVAFNHFGPDCTQRMPRVRHGYAHVVNNLYLEWGKYAIGGSMNPSILSESNLFVAPNSENKKVTWRQDINVQGRTPWRVYSVNDVFENGAYIKKPPNANIQAKPRPQYNREQFFRVVSGRFVRDLTKNAGALRCTPRSRC